VEGGGGEGGVEDVFVDCVVGGGAPGFVKEGDDAVLLDVRCAIGKEREMYSFDCVVDLFVVDLEWSGEAFLDTMSKNIFPSIMYIHMITS
jgi:hypothetical protein